jgi:putative hydrolase of the HAD superfamily
MLQYLLFDLDNTLYSSCYGLEDNVRQRIRVFMAAFLGITPGEAWQQRLDQGHQYGTTLEWLVYEKGLADADAYLAAVHPKGEADNLPPDPKLKDFLENIRIPKAILTNSPKEHADLILDKLGITGLFTHVFDIRQCRFRGKPHPDVFNNALNVLGMKAADVMFIDDNPQYVKGFIAMGGKGLLLDEENAFDDYPYPKISEIKELKQYLEEDAGQ